MGFCVRCGTALYYRSLSFAPPQATLAMAKTHDPASLKTCTRVDSGEHESKPEPSAQLSKNASTAWRRQQHVRLQHLQKEHVDSERCVAIGGDRLRSTNDLEQHEEEIVNISLRPTIPFLQNRTTLPCSEEETKAGTVLPAKSQHDMIGRKEDELSERCATVGESRAQGTGGDDEKIAVKKTGSRPLLLPPRDPLKDRAIQASNASAPAEGGDIRVSNDALCSPTAFSVAATAASLTCSSPPSCASRGERDVVNKLGSEGEAAQRIGDVQHQDLPLLLPQGRVTPRSESRLQAVGPQYQKSYNVQQLQQPHSEHSDPLKLELLQTQRSQHETRQGHTEPQNGVYEMVHRCSNQSIRNAGVLGNADENNGDNNEQRESTSTHCAAVTDRSTRVTSETSGFHQVPLKAAISDVSTTANSWALPVSRKILQSYVSAGEAEQIAVLPSPAAYGEGEIKSLTAAKTEDVIEPLPTAALVIGRKSTTATTPSSRSSTMPWGEAVADFRCSRADPPACEFCSSMKEFAFPPPPARLVAKFIAYIFEPELQRLQRRLQEHIRQEPWRELLIDCSDGEGLEKFSRDSTSAGTASRQASAPSSLSPEPPAADTDAGVYPAFARAYARETSGSSDGSCLAYPCQGKQVMKSSSASISGTCDACLGNEANDEEAGKNTSLKHASSAKDADCKTSGFPPSVNPCIPSSATTMPYRNLTELSSFSAAGSLAVASGSTGGVATVHDDTTAAAAQKLPQSALLALQLKQHLLSLVCYMERLPKRSFLGRVDNSAVPVLPACEPASPSELSTRQVFESWERRPSRDTQAATKSSSCLHHSNQFAFHIEQLLRAEIAVQSVLPIASQAKRPQVLSSPAVHNEGASVKQSGVVEHNEFTASSLDCIVNHTARADATVSEVSHAVFPEKEMSRQGSGCTSAHGPGRMLPTRAPTSLPNTMKTAEADIEVGGGGPEKTKWNYCQEVGTANEKDARVSTNTDRKGIATPESPSLLPKLPEKEAHSLPLSYSAPVSITVRDDLLPKTAEEAVLLGAPPSMVNYLIVFLPLLVLQALQQMMGAAAGEEQRGCSCTSVGYDRGTVRDSRHTQEKPTEELRASSSLRCAAHVGEDTPDQRPRTLMNAVPDAVVSRPFSLATKLTTPTAAGLKGAGGEYSCGATMASGQATRLGRRDGDERENCRVEWMRNPASETTFEIDAAGSETVCQRSPSARAEGASAAALAHTRSARVPAASGGTTNGARFTATASAYHRTGIPSSVLQAELRSALCWANRGLLALFRASSPPHASPPSSTTCHLHPLCPRTHSPSTTVTQESASNTCQRISDEVTPESLTAALLVLAKAVKQTRCGHTEERSLRASSHSYCGSRIREAVCTAGEHLVDNWHAGCNPVQHPSASCKRLSFATLSQMAPDSLSSLTSVLTELRSRPEQLWHHAHYSKRLREDVGAEAQPQKKGNALKDEERKAKVGETKGRLECASSRAFLTTSTSGEELQAKLGTLEMSRLHPFASPSLLPTSPVRDGGDFLMDREVVCPLNARARERGAAVFFAPLHYPQQNYVHCTPKDDMNPLLEAQLPDEHLPANAFVAWRGDLSKRRRAVFSPPVTGCDFKPSAGTSETTEGNERMAEDDLVERLAQEILAQVDNTAYLQREDTPGTEWRKWSGGHHVGKSGANATSEECLKFERTEAGRHANPAATEDWLRQVAQLFMERRGQEKSDLPELPCFRSCEHHNTGLSDDEEARPTRSCCSPALHDYVQSVFRQETSKTDAASPAFRCCSTGNPVMEDEAHTKARLPFSQHTKKRRYCIDGDFLLPELREKDVTSSMNCFGFAESTGGFDARRATHAENGTAGDPKGFTSFKEPPLRHEKMTPHVARPCALSKNATCGEHVDANERGSSALEVAAVTASTVAAEDDYLYIGSPEDFDTPHNAAQKHNCPSGVYTLKSARKDETNFLGAKRGEEHHHHAKYEGPCDARRARASESEVIEQEDAPHLGDTEESRLQVNLQRWATQQSERDKCMEAQGKLPSPARDRKDSSSSTRLAGVQRAISTRHRNTTKDGDSCLWENADNGESNTDSGNLRLTRRRGNHRSFVEDERNAEEVKSGQTGAPWHCGPPRRQQRITQVSDAAEESSGEKGGEQHTSRVERHVSCREDESRDHDERAAQDGGKSPRRLDPIVTSLSLDEEALRTREALSMRAPSAVYNESKERKGSWLQGNQRTSLEHLGSADETDAGLDTRRPMRGVYFDRTQRSWIGSFYEDRRQIKKRFKVNTYGFLKAKALAVDVRLDYERRMLSGVVGAADCAASPGAEAAPKLRRVAVARKDAAPSVEAVGESGKVETLLACDGTDSWTKSGTSMSPDTQQELASLSSQQRKGQLNTFPKNQSRSSSDMIRGKDTQADGDIWLTQETQSSSLSKHPGQVASRLPLLSVKKLPESVDVADYGPQGEFLGPCVEADSATTEGSDKGSSLSSYTSSTAASHVFWSSRALLNTSLNSANASSSGTAECQPAMRKEPQESKRNNVGCSLSHDDSHVLGKRIGVDAYAPPVDVEQPNTCTTELFTTQSRSGIPTKPPACSISPSKRGDVCSSHTSTRTAASSGGKPRLDPPSEKEEQERQSDHDVELTKGCRSKFVDRFYMSGDENARTGIEKTREETGRTRQRRTVSDGRCHTGRRDFGEQKPLMQDIDSRKYVHEKMLSVPKHTAASQQAEDLENGDTLEASSSKRLGNSTDQSGKCQHNCANLTEKDTAALPAHSCVNRSARMRAAAVATREKRTFLTNRMEGRSGHYCAKVGYLIEDDAVRNTTVKKESGRRITEREEKTSTSSAWGAVGSSSLSEHLQLEAHPHGATQADLALNVTRGKSSALLNSEVIPRVDGEHTETSFPSTGAHGGEPSRVTTPFIRGNSCSRACTDGCPPIRLSTKRPEVAAAAYMCSKRKKRPVDALSEGSRSAAPFFVHDLPLGVFYTSKKHAYCANWYEGKRQLKRYFPICKLGEPEARRLAIAARRDAERREREARCRTGGSSSTQAACTETKGFLDTNHAEQGSRSDSATAAPALPALFHPGDASGDVCAVQTELLQSNR